MKNEYDSFAGILNTITPCKKTIFNQVTAIIGNCLAITCVVLLVVVLVYIFYKFGILLTK